MHIVVQDFRKYVDELPSLIKKSSFKSSGIISKTGIPKASFYEKLKSGKFTLLEIEKISKVLFMEQEIDRVLRLSEKDIKAGRLKEVKL